MIPVVQLSTFRLLTMAVLLSFCVKTDSAQYYICNTAQGNNTGTDWNNAYRSFKDASLHDNNSTVPRGHVFYVAGSDIDYGPLALKNNPNGESKITIKKANRSDCSNIAGWKNEFEDKSAVFRSTPTNSAAYSVIKIYTNDWEIDGVNGNREYGYGIKLDVDECSFDFSFGVMLNGGVKNIKLSHLDIEHCGEDQGELNHTAVYTNAANTTPTSNVLISNCYIHDVNQTHFLLRNIEQWTIERCYIARRHTNGTLHGQTMSIDNCGDDSNKIHIRYNMIEDILGTGMITYGLDHRTTNSDMHVYGNIFLITDSARYGLSDAVIGSLSSNPANNNKVYNNTFVNITLRTGLNATGGIYWDSGIGNETFNNLFFNCPNLRHKNAGNDYNWYYICNDHSSIVQEPNVQRGAEDPFINASVKDFRLQTPTENSRIDLKHPYNFDMFDNKRGADGNWDRGAFEFTNNTEMVRMKPSSAPHMELKYVQSKSLIFLINHSMVQHASIAIHDLRGRLMLINEVILMPGLNKINLIQEGNKTDSKGIHCCIVKITASKWCLSKKITY